MKSLQIEQVFAAFSKAHILVVGDLIIDRYVWGNVDRISPEAPVQVVAVDSEDVRAGGAGNVVNNLLSLGCKVSLASVIGTDADGTELLGLLNKDKVELSAVQQSATRKTSCKTRVLAQRQQMLRIDRESTSAISTAEMKLLFDQVVSLLPSVQVVLISDYLKGVLVPDILGQIIDECRVRDIPVLVDPKGEDFSRYRGATALTPNRREAEIATNIKISDGQSVIEVGRKLQSDYNLDAVVLTRSEEGMSLFSQGDKVAHYPTEAREVYDVSGAGDTVIATIGAVLASGFSLDVAVKIGNMAAGVVVGKLGTSTVTPEEILVQYARRGGTTESKILSRDRVGAVLPPLKQLGKKIVFTNGCFDLLHAGHVKYLQQARQLGDLLVLGLNSDASIRRLKGDKRPLLAETERAQILAALDCIDYLVVFDEDTPLELLETVLPDILAKGGDYSADEVVGKELVESYGGSVELIQFVEGKSTTNIVDKILSRYRDE